MQHYRHFHGKSHVSFFGINSGLVRSYARFRPRSRDAKLAVKPSSSKTGLSSALSAKKNKKSLCSLFLDYVSAGVYVYCIIAFVTYPPLEPVSRDSIYDYLPCDDLPSDFFTLPSEVCRKHRKHQCDQKCCKPPETKSTSVDQLKVMEYDYLPDGYIRLVIIEPGGPEDALRLVIYPIRFLTPIASVKPPSVPAYTALSYMWGDEEDGKDIDCGGAVRPLRRNIRLFLCECRRRGELGPFWFDALCIDQQDEEEKGRQIQSMHQIYRYSQRLIVWLGDDDGSVNIKAGIDILRAFKVNSRHPLKVSTKFEEAELWQRGWEGDGPIKEETRSSRRRAHRARNRTIQELKEVFNLTGDHDSGWRAIKNVLERPYFQRCWIIQEIVSVEVEKRCIWVGKHDVSDLFSVVSVLAVNPEIEGLLHEDILISPEILPRLHNLHTAAAQYRRGTRGWRTGLSSVYWFHGYSLEVLLALYQGKQCTDPEDQVRGLRAITSALTSPPLYLVSAFVQKWLAPQPCMSGSVKQSLTEVEKQELKIKTAFFEAARDIISTERDLKILRHHNLYLPRVACDWPSWLPDWSAPRPESDAPLTTSINQDTFPSSKKSFRFEKEVLFINAHVLGKVGKEHRTLSLPDAMADAAEVEAREWALHTKPPASEREALRRFQNQWGHRFLPGPVYESAIGELQGPSNMQEGDLIVVAGKCPEPLLLRAHESQRDAYRVIGTCYIPALRESRRTSEFWKSIQWKIEEMEIR